MKFPKCGSEMVEAKLFLRGALIDDKWSCMKCGYESAEVRNGK